jgi:hypothetical protein
MYIIQMRIGFEVLGAVVVQNSVIRDIALELHPTRQNFSN